MKVEREIEIEAPAQEVWSLVGEQFNDIANWASFVSESHGNPDLEEGQGRVCQTDFGPVDETITEFQPKNRSLSHTVEGNSTPFFMRNVLNHWHVKDDGKGRSKVSFAISAEMVPPFKQLLAKRLESKFGVQAEAYINELKHFAETGTATSFVRN
jgi:carbon monoxide dehydrogenase subunit G